MEQKNKNIQRNRHDILLGQRQNTAKSFPHILGIRKENVANYVKKHHPIWHQQTMRLRYLKITKIDIETQNTGKLGLVEGVLELSISE